VKNWSCVVGDMQDMCKIVSKLFGVYANCFGVDYRLLVGGHNDPDIFFSQIVIVDGQKTSRNVEKNVNNSS